MIRTERLLLDRQRPFEEDLGIGGAALILVDYSQIVQRPRDIGMVRPERLLNDC
jgi:hypothetical protein